MLNVKLNGLRKLLRSFEEDGYCVSGKHWKIAKGGYDLYFEIYYDEIPVVDCISNELENLCLDDSVFKKIAKIIIQEYDTNFWKPMSIKENVT